MIEMPELSMSQIEINTFEIGRPLITNVKIIRVPSPGPWNDLGRRACVADALGSGIVSVAVAAKTIIAIVEAGAGSLNRFGAGWGPARAAAMVARAIDGGGSRSGRTVFKFGIARLVGSSFGTRGPIAGMNLSNSKKFQNGWHAIGDALP
ncbi:hypothetical protein DY251_18780 [Mesorhizobium denitrificans]|uniref:Uncharacterized protein n=1 Tax=Mesorhizobium denitrificans TaxID=2294114 RepID=A0A371X6E1_9HYPH|nr:hypothetical protein DY251_18780 [Mesorhizobium denitrificans]